MFGTKYRLTSVNKTNLQRLLVICGVIVLTLLACNLASGKNQAAAKPKPQAVAASGQFLSAVTASLGQHSHPRLFFTAADISALQAEANASHRDIWEPIKNYTQSQLGTKPQVNSVSRLQLETYRNFGNQLIAFAFTCVISQQPNYCDLAKTYLLTFAGWQQWGEANQRSLGLAHMLMGNALAYDWLYNQLTPDERQTVRQSLAGWSQKLYEASTKVETVTAWNNWWRDAYAQNHYSTIHSALGMAGLALLNDDDRAPGWVSYAADRLTRVQSLQNGIDDGTWHEGMGYQNYDLTMSLPFWVNLKNVTGVDLFAPNYLKNYTYWRIYNHLPNTVQFIMAFGDFGWWWGNSYKAQNILRFIAHQYSDGHAEWMAQQLIAADGRQADVQAAPWYVFEFLYYDPSIAAQPPTDLPLSRVFPDLEGVIWRTGWGPNDLVFGLKTGAYGGRYAFNAFTQQQYPWDPPCPSWSCPLNEGHDHDDTNTFYLYKSGAWLAPETADVHNYATRFHNTLLIDGKNQYRPRQSRDPQQFVGSDGFLAATASTPNFDTVAANATRRYRNIKGLTDFTRYVVFVRPDYLVMLDNMAADSPHRYQWVSHVGEQATVADNWVQAAAGGGQILGIGVVSPEPFETATGNDGQPFVRLQPAQNTANVRFINVLYPTDVAGWPTRPGLTLLDDTGTAAAVSVQLNDGSQRTDDILVNYGAAGAKTTVAHYAFDGQTAVIARDAAGKLARLFVAGGTFVQDVAANQMLVTNLAAAEPFEAIYADQSLAISGNLQTDVTLYAPQVQTVTINGQLQTFSRSNDYITVNAQ